MLVPANGTIVPKIVSGGGINDDGIPVPVVESWGDPISCRIQTNSYSEKGKYEDGKFTMSSYTIYTDIQSFTADRIKVYINGIDRGEFNVQYLEVLALTGQMKITV